MHIFPPAQTKPSLHGSSNELQSPPSGTAGVQKSQQEQAVGPCNFSSGLQWTFGHLIVEQSGQR